MALALLLLDQGEISEAIDVVESLPVNSNETQNFSDLFYILVYATQNELSLSELPQAKIEDLEDIAENRNIGGFAAQIILTQFYDKEYLSIIETDTSLEYRSQKNKKVERKLTDNKVRIHPNPVEDQLSISYWMPVGENYSFSIMGLDGSIWSQIDLDQNSGHLRMNTAGLPSAVYILKSSNGINMSELSKFIKK
ncbi:MAG: T9SS type A sorting domain-containing protein [Saprospiraceae bacterium]|nr:T9SS type A sorting domain-containing protein [Saprospiraceae bacterium]